MAATSPMDGLDAFLYAPVAARLVAVHRLLFAAMLAFAFRPQGLVAGPRTTFATSDLYLAALVVLIGLFASGVAARSTGLMLAMALVPHAFMSQGRISRQVLITALVCFAFARTRPLLRFGRAGSVVEDGPIWPIRLVQLQLSLVYGANALFKLTPHYLSGEALEGLSTRSNFLVDLTSGHLALGPVDVPTSVLAVATVAAEAWLAVGFWIPRLRWPTALFGIGFHLALTFAVSIFMLDQVTIFLYLFFLLPYVPAEAPTWLRRRLPVGLGGPAPIS